MKIDRRKLWRWVVAGCRSLRRGLRSRTFRSPQRHHVALGGILVVIFLGFFALAVLLQPTARIRAKLPGETEGKEAVAMRDTDGAREESPSDSVRQEATPQVNDTRLAFGYVGSLEIDPEWLEGTAGSAGKPAREGGEGKGNLHGGRSKKQEGKVPEIVLECAEERIEQVVAYHGFLVVAASESGLVGSVNRTTGELVPLTRRTLEGFSTRARRFPGFGKSLISRVQRTYPELGVVRLLFLCPREKEDEVIARQTSFARRHHLSLGEIDLMNGYYDGDLQVRFTRAYLRDGRVVSG
jgi:hypothetical protein